MHPYQTLLSNMDSNYYFKGKVERNVPPIYSLFFSKGPCILWNRCSSLSLLHLAAEYLFSPPFSPQSILSLLFFQKTFSSAPKSAYSSQRSKHATVNQTTLLGGLAGQLLAWHLGVLVERLTPSTRHLSSCPFPPHRVFFLEEALGRYSLLQVFIVTILWPEICWDRKGTEYHGLH